MFKDLKIDFPAILALNIFVTFAVVIVCSMVIKTPIDDGLRQALIGIVMLMVGFYFGSSKDSQKKTDAMIATSPLGVPAAPAAVTPWWSLLTPDERAKITEAATRDARAQTFTITAAAGKAEVDDLIYLVRIGALTQERAATIATS